MIDIYAQVNETHEPNLFSCVDATDRGKIVIANLAHSPERCENFAAAQFSTC
jgi:hypothetical protein